MNWYELVIYLSYKNKTIFRINRTNTHYEIGQQTSMGWIVLDKQYYEKTLKQFISKETKRELYYKKREEDNKKYERLKRKQKISEIIYQIFK